MFQPQMLLFCCCTTAEPQLGQQQQIRCTAHSLNKDEKTTASRLKDKYVCLYLFRPIFKWALAFICNFVKYACRFIFYLKNIFYILIKSFHCFIYDIFKDFFINSF